ncbi:MAG: fibronectin type III domain-containing protein [Candidatus Blackburnbacteria bacterium]|nr:fibronectin type III domain-containing protein [Candidatus Blackburnbacteria bacterium]
MKQHKLPTIAGLILLIFGIVAGVFLTQKNTIFRLAASPQEAPQDVRITNISPGSFTVSWLTDKPTVGFVSWGKSSSLGNVANQKGAAQQPITVHHVTVENLTPNTTYFFKVGSGKNVFDNNGELYKTQTARDIGAPIASDVIFGTVKTSAETPASGAVVYIAFPGASGVSALTDSQGSWSVSLSTTRNISLSSYASYNKQTTILDISAFLGAGQAGLARILAGSAKPVPPITIGKSHDFTDIKPVDSGGVPTSDIILPEVQTPPSSGFSTEQITTPAGKVTVTLTSPKDKESVNKLRPQFSGTGTPGTVVSILLESTTSYSTTLTIGKAGTWTWTPPEDLTAGVHTLTLSWKDETGGTKKLVSSFTVLAQAVGAPAATATPTASPKPSPTPVSTPAASPSLPVSGNLTVTLFLFIMGVAFVLIGLFLPKAKLFD